MVLKAEKSKIKTLASAKEPPCHLMAEDKEAEAKGTKLALYNRIVPTCKGWALRI